MGEISDDSAAALDEQIEVAGELALGNPPIVVAGAEKDGVVTEMSADEIFAQAGNAESGGFTAVMRKADFASRPEKGSTISARGMSLTVGRVESGTAHYVVTAIDPTAA